LGQLSKVRPFLSAYFLSQKETNWKKSDKNYRTDK
jgi:hypothetical protein